MYEYSKGTLGAVTRHEKGRYIPPTETSLSPWPKVETEIDNIKCMCYQNAPREEILSRSVPFVMEIHTPNNAFVCACEPRIGARDCPEEIHGGADPKDPWRHRRCADWRESRVSQAAEILSTPEFRERLTENVLDIAGITGLERTRAKDAEFMLLVVEREKRARAIKIAGGVVLLASAGVLSLRYFVKKAKKEEK